MVGHQHGAARCSNPCRALFPHGRRSGPVGPSQIRAGLPGHGPRDRPDPYSYVTGDQLWFNHEWLAEAIFAFIYRLAGAAGLIWFKLLAAVSIGLIIYAGLRRAQLAPLRALTIVALSAAWLSVGVSMVRPHLFIYVAFALLLLILVRAEAGPSRWLLVLPPLFAVWANSHGGFLAGVAVLFLWLFTSIILAVRARVQTGHLPTRSLIIAAATTLTCLLATLVNPYGINLWRFLLETATIPRPEITEWQAISLPSALGLAYLALLITGGAALVSSRRPHNLFRSLGFIGLALAPLVAVRHAPLFAIAMPLLLAPELAETWARLPQKASDTCTSTNHPHTHLCDYDHHGGFARIRLVPEPLLGDRPETIRSQQSTYEA